MPIDTDQGQPDRRVQRHESRTSATFRDFLREVMAAIDVDDEIVATNTAATVLCLLSQRLIGEEARDLHAQLPQKVREILTQCRVHEGSQEKFGRAEMVSSVAQDLGLPLDAAEARIRAVFKVVAAHVSEGEVKQVIHGLPRRMRDLWPVELVAAVDREDELATLRAQRGSQAEQSDKPRP